MSTSPVTENGTTRWYVDGNGVFDDARVGALTVLQASEMADWAEAFEPTDGDQ